MQLDHFNIAAPRDLLEEVRDFYCDVLGFKEGFRPDFQKHGFWLYAGDKPFIHLIESDRHFAHEKPVYLDHIAFSSSGLTALQLRLDQNGIAYRKRFIGEFEMTQLFFKDPAGTGLEINFPGES